MLGDNGLTSRDNRRLRRRGLYARRVLLPALSRDQAASDEMAPEISMGLTLAQLSTRLRCVECGGPLQSVKPWRQADMIGKPQGRRG